MADYNFFQNSGPFKATELAQISGADLAGTLIPDFLYMDVRPLDNAGKTDVSFLDNKKYKETFLASSAGLCIIRPSLLDIAPTGMGLLLTHDPYGAYARIASSFYPVSTPLNSISDRSLISNSARLGKNCSISAGVIIGENVSIGDNCTVGPNTEIMSGCKIEECCSIGSNVTIQCCMIGKSVIIHPGVRIGQDGFGFAPGTKGHFKVPQLGRVIIGDLVEIGANTTIDRGAGPDTIIGDGTKIDNLVQIGHNVQVGNHCLIVAQVGISGSTKIGDFTMIGGQTGIAGHLNIGSGVKIAAQSGVMRDIINGETVCGTPSRPMKKFMREIATVQKLAKTKG
jgi:UDP-3-O-[3-hydroxymyristoyl] glucosamine N-acyltransferase